MTLGQQVQGTRSWDALMGRVRGMQSWEYCAQSLSVKHGGEANNHAGGEHLLLGRDIVTFATFAKQQRSQAQ